MCALIAAVTAHRLPGNCCTVEARISDVKAAEIYARTQEDNDNLRRYRLMRFK